MILPQLVPFALLGTAFIFALIELGLSGHIVSAFGESRRVLQYDPNSSRGYSYRTVKASVPAILAFLVFASVWTLLVSIAAAALPWVFRRKVHDKPNLNTLITFGLLGTYFVTMVFWLGGFADIAASLSLAAGQSDYLNAIIAFAVLLWLVFLALFIISILAICGVLKSDLPGYKAFQRQTTSSAVDPQGTQMETVKV
ncbi:hypothetical protein BBP40_005588 [Aspergillus hancockii]|nr:hypothetical protein BBP40_005588 [Aspergillus hancockii]